MKDLEKLLKQAESFEKLATYGDRRTFLKAIAQDRPDMPSGPFKDPEPNFESKYSPEIAPHKPTGLGMLGLTEQQTNKPQIADKMKDKVYPAYQAYSAPASKEQVVNDAYSVVQNAQPLLVAGKPWLKVDEYNAVRSQVQDTLMKLDAKKKALLTDIASPERAESIKAINQASTVLTNTWTKLFGIYNRLAKGKGGLKEQF